MSDEKKPDSDAARLEAVGTAMFGNRWKRPLAEKAGLDHSTLMHATRKANPRSLSAESKRRLRAYVTTEAAKVIEEARRKADVLARASLWWADD